MECKKGRSENATQGVAEVAEPQIEYRGVRGLPGARRSSNASADGLARGAVRVLFVCTGNLCRSPMAEAVSRVLASAAGIAVPMEFDSAGLDAIVGAPIDPRARKVLERGGYAIRPRRARRVEASDFVSHDLIVAMGRCHLDGLREACPSTHAHKLRLLLDFASGPDGRDVPDPYYGNAAGFAEVLRLCETGVRGLLWAQANAAMHGSTGRRP